MDRNDRIIYLHFKGESVRSLSAQFNLPYAKVYQIVNSAKDEIAELKKEVSSLNSQLESERYEIKRLKEQPNEAIEHLEQSKLDNIKLLVRLHRLKKKVEFLENKLDEKWMVRAIAAEKKLNQIELNYEKLREEKQEALCKDSKILAKRVLEKKNLRLLS